MNRKLGGDPQLVFRYRVDGNFRRACKQGRHLSLPAKSGERTAADHLPLQG